MDDEKLTFSAKQHITFTTEAIRIFQIKTIFQNKFRLYFSE